MNLGRGSTFRFVGGILLAVTIVLVGVYLLLIAGLQHALDQQLASLRAQGVPTEWKQVIPPPVPDKDNAAILYQQAENTAAVSLSDRTTLMEFIGRRATSASRRQRLPAVRRILAHNQRALHLYKQAAAKPRCRFPFNWNDDPDEMLMPQYAGLRTGARLLAAEALVAAYDGNADRAVESLRTGIRIQRHAQADPVFVGFLVGTATETITLSVLPEIAQHCRLDATQCKALFDDLGRMEFDLAFQKALGAETCSALALFTLLEQHPERLSPLFGTYDMFASPPPLPVYVRVYASPLAKTLRLRDEIAYVDLAQQWLPATTKPLREGMRLIGGLEKLRHEIPRYLLMTNRLAPPYSMRMTAARDKGIALRNAMQVMLALEAYHLKYGKHPDSLAALKTYPGWKLPADPFSGKDFVYRRIGAGYLFYSLGQNLKDDNGLQATSGWDDGDMVWVVER